MSEIPFDRSVLRGFSPILDTVLDAVVIMDADGIVLGWNQVACETFGWGSDEAVGRALADLIVPAQHRAAHCAGLARYRDTGKAHVLRQRIEITALRKSGEEFPVELSITVAGLGAHHVFIGYLRDISDRWQAEQAARQQAAILGQLAEGVIVADAAGASPSSTPPPRACTAWRSWASNRTGIAKPTICSPRRGSPTRRPTCRWRARCAAKSSKMPAGGSTGRTAAWCWRSAARVR
jgi:PAS domain S-box-containing protein